MDSLAVGQPAAAHMADGQASGGCDGERGLQADGVREPRAYRPPKPVVAMPWTK